MKNKSYYGGKSGDGVYQKIINQIPEHDITIIPFYGKGGVFKNMKRAKRYFLADIDGEVCHNTDLPIICQNWKYTLSAIRTELHRRNLEFAFQKVFSYLDPPYPMSTRKSDRPRYKFEMTDEQHIELLKYIAPIHYERSYIAISTYDNDMYREHLQHWRKIQFNAPTRNGSATETLYMNYPPPAKLHDYRYLGDNKAQRQAIKRKLQRHLNSVKSWTIQEQNYFTQLINRQATGEKIDITTMPAGES